MSFISCKGARRVCVPCTDLVLNTLGPITNSYFQPSVKTEKKSNQRRYYDGKESASRAYPYCATSHDNIVSKNFCFGRILGHISRLFGAMLPLFSVVSHITI